MLFYFYCDLCLQHSPNIRWFTNKGTPLKLGCFGGESVFESGPLIDAGDCSNFVSISEGSEDEGGTGVNVGGLVFDVEAVVLNIIGNFSSLPFNPINDFHLYKIKLYK